MLVFTSILSNATRATSSLTLNLSGLNDGSLPKAVLLLPKTSSTTLQRLPPSLSDPTIVLARISLCKR